MSIAFLLLLPFEICEAALLHYFTRLSPHGAGRVIPMPPVFVAANLMAGVITQSGTSPTLHPIPRGTNMRCRYKQFFVALL